MLSGGSTVTSETNITVVSDENGVEVTAENDSNETEATLVDEEETDNVASEISITTSETSTDSTVTETEPADEATSVVEESVDISPVEKAKKKSIFRRNKKIDESGSAAKIAKKLKNRNSMNMKRKIVHVLFGVGFASLNHALPREYFKPFMLIVNTGNILVEVLRYKKGFGWMNKTIHLCLGSSIRKHEMEGKFLGSLYYFNGVTLSTFLYPKTATTLGIMQLALADPSASYFGRKTKDVYWSRIENGFFGLGRNKGVLGFLGGALVCFPFNYQTLTNAKWGPDGVPGGKRAILLASIALGVAGSFADLSVPTPALTLPPSFCGIKLPPLSVDDNFVVPVVSGWACMKIFNHLGWSHDLQLSNFWIF